MDWTSAVLPIVGTLVGAGASYLGTNSAQKKALAAARQARVDTNQDAAIVVLTESLTGVLRHIRGLPPTDDAWKDDQEEKLWSEKLWRFVGPAAMAARTLRDEHVRLAILEVFDLLEDWDMLFYAYKANDGYRVVLHAIAKQGVLALTAFQREEPLPAPGELYRDAKEAHDRFSEQLEAHWAEEKAERAAATGLPGMVSE